MLSLVVLTKHLFSHTLLIPSVLNIQSKHTLTKNIEVSSLDRNNLRLFHFSEFSLMARIGDAWKAKKFSKSWFVRLLYKWCPKVWRSHTHIQDTLRTRCHKLFKKSQRLRLEKKTLVMHLLAKWLTYIYHSPPPPPNWFWLFFVESDLHEKYF